MPSLVISNQEAVLSQNHSVSDPLEAMPGRYFHTFVISKLGCCLLISECFLAYFLMKMKCIFEKKISLAAMNCIFCSLFNCYILSAFKEYFMFLALDFAFFSLLEIFFSFL